MRTNKILKKIISNKVPDGYGGFIESLGSFKEYDCYISSTNTKLPYDLYGKLPSQITSVVCRFGDLKAGDIVQLDDIRYTVLEAKPVKKYQHLLLDKGE